MNDLNDEWFARAQRVIPGGVDSPVRSFSSVGGTPVTVDHGKGAYLYDVDGHRYVDMIQSYGAVILGHADPGITSALYDAVSKGTTFGTPTRGEVLLAEEICARVPGCDQVRFVSSGTEAAMSAIRLARGVTGRDRMIKFAGCYHGHSDGLLAKSGSGVATMGLSGSGSGSGSVTEARYLPDSLPGSAGVPVASVSDTIICPYNQVPSRDVLDEKVACVIVEPVAANMGVVPPVPGFLQGLRTACNAVGALLIFDEVITGFRVAYSNASTICGVIPDIYCFGKVIGGGLPLAAFGGRTELLKQLAPVGPVYQAGTLSGNPLATAAGLSVLNRLDEDAFAALAGKVDSFVAGLQAALSDAGLEATVQHYGTLCSMFFGTSNAVSDYDAASASAATGIYSKFFHHMLDGGVMLPPGPYEALFVGLAHSDADLDYVLEQARTAASKTAMHL
ncbi:MAG: glutamate-1-semialdehyde 2,1-aminomutase [Actinobacteria bacterium]|nr:glutamate-1-semialdehyde 2,1-aminomutase [Actinomycetota bacterium]